MLRIEINCGMTLYHADTFNELKIERTITQDYDEKSESYKKLCEAYKEDIGFEREKDEDTYDKKMLEIFAEECKKNESETIKNIESAFKRVCRDKTTGVLSYAGYLIRMQDFCVLRIDEFKTNIKKVR